MAYSVVPTVATGDLWTAANHNTYIKDNFAAGVPDIFTTKGDLAVATAADAASRLAVGSNGQLIEAQSAESTGLKWQGYLQVLASMSSDFLIAHSTVTIVGFDTETIDTDAAFTTGTSAKFTAPRNGLYQVSFDCNMKSESWTAGNEVLTYVYVDGSLYFYMPRYQVQATVSCRPTFAWTVALALNATQYVDVRIWQNSGGNRNIEGGQCHIHVVKIR